MPLLGKRSRRRAESVSTPPGPPTSSPVRSSSIPPSSPPQTPVKRVERSIKSSPSSQPETQAQPSHNPVALLQNHDTSPSIDAIVITSLDILPFCCHEDLCLMSKRELVQVAKTLNNKLPSALKIDLGEEDEGENRERRWIRKEIERVVDIKVPDPLQSSGNLVQSEAGSHENETVSVSVSAPPPAPKVNRMTSMSRLKPNSNPNHPSPGYSPTTLRTPPRLNTIRTGPSYQYSFSFPLGGTPTSTASPSYLGTPTLERLEEVDEDSESSDLNDDGDEGRHGRETRARPARKRRRIDHGRKIFGKVKERVVTPVPQRGRSSNSNSRPHPLSKPTLTRSRSSLNELDKSGSSEEDMNNILTTPTPAPISSKTRARPSHESRSKSVSLLPPFQIGNDHASVSNPSRTRTRSRSLSLTTSRRKSEDEAQFAMEER
ncbi:hypothetical protein K435DRAFT_118767 [Dendrothele bispora CBS 962.96]|uniref:Uncharacterized protein n=1 Tax=Dendrothele bispora (strain CBS 962.96) TaxID=1314807 RepID=A0A4S8MQD9_DENBC|nr:hypothetical protein K435DRAFT_118767 [Dendrothele bispora CBS 962.96]